MSQFTPLPAGRISHWHATVGEPALRALDEQLLLDLLVIEEDDARRRDVAAIVADYLRSADTDTAHRFELRCRDLGVGAIVPTDTAFGQVSKEPKAASVDSTQPPAPRESPTGPATGTTDVRQRYVRAIAGAETAWQGAAANGMPDLATAFSAVDDLVESLQQDRQAILALTETEDAADDTFTHMVNVSVLTIDQARTLEIDGQLLRDLGLAALLHDIGKVLTPKEILDKPERLTPAEFEIMQRHTIDGAKILRRTPGMPALAPIVAFEHHLRLDGSGYPAAARREQLNLGTMICSIADVYDAMRSQRAYQPAYPADQILAVLRRGRRPQFDPDLVQRFFELLEIHPPGRLAGR